MRVFLTGATGYIGSVVAEKLQAAGYSVVGLARSRATAAQLEARGIEPFLGDLQNPERLEAAAQQVDGVIHTAFIHDFENWSNAVQADCQVIQAFIQALAGSGKPLITTSDTSVLGDTGSTIANEAYPIAQGFLLAERAKAEQLVLDSAQQNIRSAVLRLPLYIYGRGGGTSYIPTRMATAQERQAVQYIESGEHQVSAVHVEDVAQLYVLALERAIAGSVFHAGAESGITEKAIAQAISQVVNYPIVSILQAEAELVWGSAIAMFFSINNQTSADKAKQQLGWNPQATLSFLQDIELGSNF
ncbi:MAG: SDR family oxidoreductase [Oculatellaceae cyanobacterium Prado106]|jgi:nucleoside-diphosphate-sugar epimerase|nr:SDR family oxidoreductase [Oculatellaceae cyanobacterium Prado106]